jgi:hypothetical protein
MFLLCCRGCNEEVGWISIWADFFNRLKSYATQRPLSYRKLDVLIRAQAIIRASKLNLRRDLFFNLDFGGIDTQLKSKPTISTSNTVSTTGHRQLLGAGLWGSYYPSKHQAPENSTGCK